MDLATAADIAQIQGLATIVGGGAVALVQLRNFKRERRDVAAFNFVNSWSTAEVEALQRVYALPDAADPAAINDDPASLRAAAAVLVNCERLGFLVFGRQMDLAMANEFGGGAVRAAWRKLRPWVLEQRRIAQSKTFGEWMEWLADRFADEPLRDPSVGAFEKHRGWRP